MPRNEDTSRLRQRVKDLQKQLQLLEQRNRREGKRWQATIDRMARYLCQNCNHKTDVLHRCEWCDSMVCNRDLVVCSQCTHNFCDECFVKCRCGIETCMPCSSNEPSICRSCGLSYCYDCARESKRPLEPCHLCGSAVCSDCSPTHKCNVPEDQ